jgi:hypothetical protein
MPRTVCLATGPILGLNAEHFLAETKRFGDSVGKRIDVFDLIDEIAENQGHSWDNPFERLVYIGQLLDGYQYQFDLLRENAYLSIARKIDRLPQRAGAIVRAPACIRWRGIPMRFKDHRAIASSIAPTRILTLINAEHLILEQLKGHYGQRGLELIAQESKAVDLEWVLDWLGAEVSASEDLADWCTELTGKRVGHYVISIRAPSYADRSKFVLDVDNMAKAATAAKLPSFYASYSMTVAEPRERDLINDAVWKLRGYGLVVDPGTIEIGARTAPEDEGIVFAYTVFRDLRWDVAKVDTVAAFHPYAKKPPLSTGMMDELGHARAFGKDRYLVLPSGGGSPFTSGNYVPKNHFFTSIDAFFKFIKKRRRPQLKPQFADQVEAFKKEKPEPALSKRRSRSRPKPRTARKRK